jgi:peptidoglycan/LPS O-acetylase OafA/YrhL
MRFDSIQALRGISAVLVVLEHIRFFSVGSFGVDIFFCISGFMMMFTTQERTRGFFLKRLLRIVPLYYAMTVGTYLLLLAFPQMFRQTEPRFSFLVKSLLFLPFDIGGGVLQPLLRIGWTVNCEMFFYLLFAAALRVSHRFRGLICGGLLCAAVALGQLLPAPGAFLSFYGSPVMLEFIWGILCYGLVRAGYRRLRPGGILEEASGRVSPVAARWLCRGALWSALAAVAVLLLTEPRISLLGLRRPLLWGLPALFIVLCFFLAGTRLRPPAWSVRLGDMSFSVYLVHYYPVLFIDRVVCDFSVLNPVSALGAAFSFLLVLLLSGVSFRLVEKKLTGWLRSRLIR